MPKFTAEKIVFNGCSIGHLCKVSFRSQFSHAAKKRETRNFAKYTTRCAEIL